MDSPDRKNLHVLIACFLGMVFDGMDASIYVLTLHPCLKELLGAVSDSDIGVYGSLIMALFMPDSTDLVREETSEETG